MQLGRFLVEAIVLGKQSPNRLVASTRSRAVGSTNCWLDTDVKDRLVWNPGLTAQRAVRTRSTRP
jgi:hypothetical protein